MGCHCGSFQEYYISMKGEIYRYLRNLMSIVFLNFCPFLLFTGPLNQDLLPLIM